MSTVRTVVEAGIQLHGIQMDVSCDLEEELCNMFPNLTGTQIEAVIKRMFDPYWQDQYGKAKK